MEATVKLTGFDKAIANLKSGEQAIPREFFNAMTKVVNTIASSARSEAPFRTGTLRRSISTTNSITESKGSVYADPQQAPYAMRIEYGFNGADSLGRNYHQKPNEFMKRALDQNKSMVVSTFKEATKKLAHIMAQGGT